ncbi:phosphatidylglycerophosphatase A [bacterium]|nr:phosphatidylglycerophosphatase A [bacterium]
MNKIYFVLATWFGSGLLPKMPGTWGTIFTFLIFWFLPEFSALVFVLIILVLFFIGVFSSQQVEITHGHDAQIIVIDETVGYLISVVFLPKTLFVWLAGVVFFRCFDVWKPFPIRKMERFKGGFGVMLDDVLAGVYANLVLQAFLNHGLHG